MTPEREAEIRRYSDQDSYLSDAIALLDVERADADRLAAHIRMIYAAESIADEDWDLVMADVTAHDERRAT